MFNDITPLISHQIPEHLQSDSPLFVDFLKTYYAYANQRNKAIGVIQNHSSEIDIDYCSEEYVVNFYKTYGNHIPTQLAYDRRNFIKILNQIYNAKGTENALRLVFQAVFGENVEVSYPGDQILKASDGIWIREKFITLKTEYGNIPNGDAVSFSFSNVNGDYSFESSKIENLPESLHRIHFRSQYELTFVDNQMVYHYNTNGVLIYVGKLVYSPAKIVISNPGKNWIKGQAIIIPGTVKNTVAKVLSVDNVGAITSIEISEYGYTHGTGQVATMSPYRTKPISPTTSLTSTMTLFNPLTYHHELSIHDYVGSIDEVITRTHTDPINGSTVDVTTNVPNIPAENADRVGLTLDDWYSSRAVFVVEFDRVVTPKGFYENSQGQLSNQNVKLQDNYYYQAFSYLLETARDIREYRDLLNITHPAGLKRFSKLSKAVDFILTYDVSRTLSVDTIYLLSIYTAIDSLAKNIDKTLSDTANITETISKQLSKTYSDLVTLSDTYANQLTKYFTETITTNDSDFINFNKVLSETLLATDTDTIDFTKPLSEQLNAIDQYIIDYQKNVTDGVSIIDSFFNDYLKPFVETLSVTDTDIIDFTKPLSEIVYASDIFNIQTNKYFIDTITVSHIDVTSVVTITYAAEDYFAEHYTPVSYSLTIG